MGPMGGNMNGNVAMGGNMGPMNGNLGSANFNQSKFDTFEQDFMMPPDIASINSEINKLNAMTPFSDQFMPNAGGMS